MQNWGVASALIFFIAFMAFMGFGAFIACIAFMAFMGLAAFIAFIAFMAFMVRRRQKHKQEEMIARADIATMIFVGCQIDVRCSSDV